MTYMDICFPWEDLGDNISHQKRYLIAREKLQEFTELKQELDRLVSGVPAVGLIEKHWLEHHHRIRGPARNRAATRLAAWWKAVPSQRAYKAFCRARKANRAAVTLQRFWRRELNRRKAALQRELAEHAAIVSRVQALWRGRVARRKVGKLRQEAAERSADLRAAMFIQAAYKRNREKRRTLVEGIAAMKVALVWRSFLARRKLQRQMSAEYIQLYWRNLKRRKVTRENRAATTIQSIRRGNLVRRENARQKELIIRLQTRRRGTVARRVAEDLRQAAARDSRVVHATTFIQAIFKGNRARQNFLFEKMMRERASIIIQCLWRGSKARKETGKHREHLVRVQALWRGALARREVNELREAIVLEDRVINAMTFIQAMYKGNAQRRKYLWEKMMVTRVQRTWRRFVWQRRLRRASATKTIQLYWRWRKAALRGEEGRRRAAIALQTR
ncbi:conserved hypothetical protein [Perkinsus marinus ATCC 50983]|uniref:Uncharacterized protein n=1 Tax=Perkinsus marinus (strain ATCC 50983 / TXsc) TaxID=423536 RepID=C5KHV5_PERM5|nr:conserved hypothetical protein [Perkinsus marinus ATCC 50983]EER16167.1 conserved hypothetical protein [Perkinsus marinus ATCC 50983]|eukprot:XP_002784371.1 conserved hypothetical protein [Perkinsus marinus ATCC 50983]